MEGIRVNTKTKAKYDDNTPDIEPMALFRPCAAYSGSESELIAESYSIATWIISFSEP
jgi:hypothetical protein